MAGGKTIVQLEYNSDVESLLKEIGKFLKRANQPDVIYVKFSPSWFPRRDLDVPDELNRLFHVNPRVKPCWDCLFDEERYQEFCQFMASNDIQLDVEHEYLDMTVVSVFYDAAINPMRKVATKKAVNCWMKQTCRPKEMMFIELGFNGVFTFSQDDFPKEIQYVRIEGNDTNKYLFQKEHLWNIAAKQAKYEKLMFMDSDIAPLDDVDWFRKVYDTMDTCLFSQGFNQITYLDQDDAPTGRVRPSYTTQIVQNQKLSYAVPGGVYCITKQTLQIMGYFNFLPFGGGDNVFWSELAGLLSYYPWFVICRRDNIPVCM